MSGLTGPYSIAGSGREPGSWVITLTSGGSSPQITVQAPVGLGVDPLYLARWVRDALNTYVAEYHPAGEDEPFGNYISRQRAEAAARGDPPMGYGYRQLHADPSQVYALRWGQSGRITGYANADRDAVVAGLAGDPSTLVYIETPGELNLATGVASGLAWAMSQRWEVVS